VDTSPARLGHQAQHGPEVRDRLAAGRDRIGDPVELGEPALDPGPQLDNRRRGFLTTGSPR
jgi:hypothetical protein